MLIAVYPLLAALAQPGTSASNEVIEDFSNGFVAHPQSLISVEGFRAGDKGWYLDAGANGRLVYRITGKSSSQTAINLWINSPAGVTSTVIARTDGRADTTLISNKSLSGARLFLPGALASRP